MSTGDTQERLRTALADRYTLESSVGEGGMATVYLADDRKHGRRVAIKVLKAELAASLGTERFLREIEIAARLQHPHILPVYDSGEADGILYFVMPYVEGESLRDRIHRERRIPPTEAARYAREVASALDYAHRQDVIHRDIKPANILLSEGHAVVADFGIARAVRAAGGDGLTQVGMAVGTPWYMSPEQATADPKTDGRTDIYALGCVLFEMLSGKPPYDGPSAQSIIAKTLSAPVPDVADLTGGVPTPITKALTRALAKDPDDRFATAGEFAAALEVGSGELAIATTRSRWTRAALAVAGGAAAAVVAMVAFSPRDAASSSVVPGAEIIAVMPFDATGPTVELLGEGMVNLLATNLNDVGGIRTVDPRTILHRWRREGGDDGLDLNGALAVGRDVDAASVLLGSVVEAGTGVRLSAELYNLDGSSMGRVQVTGHADSVLSLVDSLSISLLREIWRSREPIPAFDVSAITTGSVDAIRAYLRGFQLFRTAAFGAAAEAFEEAVRIDSTFALAYLQLANAYAWTDGDGSPRSIAAITKATEYSNRLPSRERVLIAAYIKYTQGQYEVAIDTLDWFLERYPTDAYGWSVMAEIRFHEQHVLFLPPEDRLAPFDRVLELDSSFVSALLHPLEIALVSGNRELFHRYYQLIETHGGNDRGLGLGRHVVWGDNTAQAASALATLAEIGAAGMGPVVVALLAHGDRAHIDRTVQILDSLSTIDQPGRATAMEFAAASHIALGQLDGLDRIADLAYGTRSPENITAVATLHLMPYLLGMAPRTSADRASAMLLAQPTTSDRAQTYLAGLMALAARDTAMVARMLRATDSTQALAPFRAAAGWLALQRGDTTQAVEQWKGSLDTPDAARRGVGRALNGLRIELARARAATASTRPEAIRRFEYGFTTFTAIETLPLAKIALGDLLAVEGDTDGAADAYRDALRLWEAADASLEPAIDAVRDKLARVSGQ